MLTLLVGVTVANDWLQAEIMKDLGVSKGRR